MNIKKTAKKIVALASGTAMVGATLMGAMAYDLSDFPDQFIVDGQFDGKIVIGANAKPSDVLGSIDIAAGIQAASTTEVPVGDGTTTTVLEGDAIQIRDGPDLLEIGEQMGSVLTTVTGDDLAMLADGRVTTQKGTTDYTQTLNLDGIESNSGIVKLAENHDDEVGLFLFFDDGETFMDYELEFTSGLESDIGSNDELDDFEDETIFMLGQYYSIVDAELTGGQTGLELNLIAGDVVDTLEEGQTKTYQVDGMDYEVTVLVVGSGSTPSVKFLINGEVTNSMNEGETDTLSDGTEIGVREILVSEKNFEGDQGSVVEFYLGANKIKFSDSDFSAADGGDVDINREDIDDATLELDGTISGGTFKLNSISYKLATDSAKQTDVYVAPGTGIREYLDEPEGMLNAEWDFHFAGVSEPESSEIRFEPSGDDEYTLTFTNRDGQTFSVPYAENTGGSNYVFGNSDEKLVFVETAGNASVANDFNIKLDDYFIITDKDDDNKGQTFVYQFTDVDTSDKTVSFTNVATGQERVETYKGTIGVPGSTNTSGNGTITAGGQQFDFRVVELSQGSGEYAMAVDLDNDGSFTADYVNVVVKGGGILDLGSENAVNSTWNASLTTLAEDVDGDELQVEKWTFTAANNELDVGTLTNVSGTFYTESDNDVDKTYGVNKYGTWFEITDDTNNADELVITYPVEQVEALVYVVGGDVQSSVSSSGTTAQQINVLPVGLAVLDTDVSVDSDNLIVVGGPCVNDIAAELLGSNPNDCAEGFVDGMAMIRAFETGGHVAVLVAGYSADDTVRASRVLAEAFTTPNPDLVGDAVEISWPSGSEPVITAPDMSSESSEDSE